MIKHTCVLCCLLLVTPSATPLPARELPQTSQEHQEHLVGSCAQPCLEDGTPVKLRFAQTVSSAEAHVNDQIEFEVLEEVRISDTVIIPKGGIAWGTVTEAEPKRRMGRGGKLEIVMDSVRLGDGEKAALRATKEVKGGSHTGAMTAGIVATGLILWPAAPFFLFMHGKDISIPKGTEVPTFVNGNFQLEMAKFNPHAPGAAAEAIQVASNTAELNINSTPTGADISIDGAFVGNTPSTVSTSSGDHTVLIAKNGYKSWQRNMKVSGGKIAITADLEREPR